VAEFEAMLSRARLTAAEAEQRLSSRSPLPEQTAAHIRLSRQEIGLLYTTIGHGNSISAAEFHTFMKGKGLPAVGVATCDDWLCTAASVVVGWEECLCLLFALCWLDSIGTGIV
jgi:hypothetical protein